MDSRFRVIGFRVVRIILGLSLIISALLKFDQLLTDPLSQYTSLWSPPVVAFASGLEFLLGGLLLSQSFPACSWTLATALFSGLLVVSLFLVTQGYESCGCLGNIDVSPWLTVSVDIVALFTLFAFRPSDVFRKMRVETRQVFHDKARVAGGAFALAITAIGLSFLLFTDAGKAIVENWRGQYVQLAPGELDLGEGIQGEAKSVKVTIENRSSIPVNLIGGEASCTCIAIKGLPAKIPANGSVDVELTYRFVGQPNSKFRRKVVYFCDHPVQHTVVGYLNGTVVSGWNHGS